MFSNTSTIKTNQKTNNNQSIVLELELQSRLARVEMTVDEWRNIHDYVSRQTVRSQVSQTISVPMIFESRPANLNMSKKEYRCLQETVLLFSHDNPKKPNGKVTIQMNLNNRPARVEMTKAELARWMCLIEAIDLIEKKCEEINVNMSDTFWIQPIAMQKYMESRFETMMDEVNQHDFGIDTKSANMNILKRKRTIEQNETIEEEDEINDRYSLCTS
jgi:hypothetical protein